jgi:dipeptidyl aminopeptidase/acylaminoacyl peptidase
VFLSACGLEANQIADEERASIELTEQAAALTPTPRSPATPQPTPTPPGWLTDLATPAPTLDPPTQAFLRNGPDLWLVADDLSFRHLTVGERFQLFAGSPDGSRAAVVFPLELGGRQAEEVRLITAAGAISEPLWPPEIVSGPGANPRISGLLWSRDGGRLVLAFDDGRLAVTDPDQPDETGPRVILASGVLAELEIIGWTPRADAVVLLADRDGTGRRLHVLSVESGALEAIPVTASGQPPVRAAAWLPNDSRLIVIEEQGIGFNPRAGSLLRISADGDERELIVSAGSFAPAAQVRLLSVSPGGRWVAFAVYIPTAESAVLFHSLWVLDIETGGRMPVPVPADSRPTDLTWLSQGLLWRAVHQSALVPPDATRYVGTEPFSLWLYDPISGATSLLHRAPDG